MSEGTTEATETASAAKRKSLTMGERVKVVDYLRSLVEPIVAESNTAAASFIRDATGVEINWPQLKYMLDDPSLAEMKLATKIHVKSLLSAEDERWAAMEARVAQLEARITALEEKP